MNIKVIQSRLRRFAKQRKWEQFHTPKNLAMALSVEVAELVEIFQWLTPEESWSPDRQSVKHEVGDILIYTLMLADKLGIDVESAIMEKIELNKKKHPDKRDKWGGIQSD